MALAIENFSSGTAAFPTAMSSSVAGAITTGGTDRLVVIVIGTGRSRADGASENVGNPAVSVSASGLTFTRIELDEFKYDPFAISGGTIGDGSFPNANMAWAIFTAPAAAQQTAVGWTCTIDEDTFFNNGVGYVFAISGLPDINDVDVTTLSMDENLTNTATRPSVPVTTTTEAVVLGLLTTANSGFTFQNMSGYTLSQATASGNATTNVKWASYRGVEASAVAAKEIGEPAASGTVVLWHGIAIAFGSPDPAPTVANALVTSVAAEVMHTGDEPNARVSSVAAEALLTSPSAARISSVAVEVLVSTELPPPLDGSRFLEATFHTKPTLNFSEEDYDSIWSLGDRNVSGIMTFGEYGMTISPGATMASSHNGNYAFPTGSGLAITGNPLVAGAAAWFDFNGEEVDLRGFKLMGTEEFTWADTEIWTLFGGFETGVLHSEPYTADFDAFVPAQATENTDLGLFETEFTFQPRDGQAWSHYEYVFRSTENLSEGRFANEIQLKVAHSPLDGGNRRPDNDRPDKRVAFSMSSDWTWTDTPGTFIDPQLALFDGVPVYLGFPAPGGDEKNGEGFFSIIHDPVETNGIQSTVGAWFQFEFPRKVIFKHLMLIQLTQAEEYVSDVPQHYGTWHWEYSNDGLGWTSIGDPWSFCEDAKYMVAPRTGRFDLDTTGLGDGATHWRMVLNSGPAFRNNYALAQFIFNLDDVGALSNTLSIAFTDDADNAPPSPTITGASPFNVFFSDGTTDVLTLELTNVPNFDGTLDFTDGTSDALEFYSDLLPSIFGQTVVVATGRS